MLQEYRENILWLLSYKLIIEELFFVSNSLKVLLILYKLFENVSM